MAWHRFRYYITLAAFMAVTGIGGLSCAQDITVTQEMSFGEGVVTDNSSQKAILLEADGDYTVDAGITLTTPPQPGIYQLSGVTPLTAITNITVTVDQQLIGSGEGFTIDNFDIDYPPNVDVNGEAVIRIGARMQTSGNNNGYNDSTVFQSAMTLNVIY